MGVKYSNKWVVFNEEAMELYNLGLAKLYQPAEEFDLSDVLNN